MSGREVHAVVAAAVLAQVYLRWRRARNERLLWAAMDREQT